MKTSRDRAEEWLHKFVGGKPHKHDINNLELLLKEQDKITRHACAEAVSNTDLDFMKAIIDRDEAHRRCMNVKAV